MVDDIITRLRGYDFMRDGDIPDVIMNEAADEIERLRYEVQRWKQLAKREIVMCDPNDPCEMCKELADG
jgi:hypothetical protein